jgi:chromosome segregation ATPase
MQEVEIKGVEEKEEFEKGLETREKERAEKKAEAEAIKEKEEDPEEKMDYIESKIKDMITQIEEGLKRVPDLKGNKTELSHHFNTLFTLFAHLREYLANILFCLPNQRQ